MRCGLLMTNLGASLRFRSASCAAKGLTLRFGPVLGKRTGGAFPLATFVKKDPTAVW
jgi:hypothetical protein